MTNGCHKDQSPAPTPAKPAATPQKEEPRKADSTKEKRPTQAK
jgi:hypothetical protein